MDLMAIRRRVLLSYKKKLLPDGYTQLKYIQTNGKQFIDTDVEITDMTDVIRAIFACTSGTQINEFVLFGGYVGKWALHIGSTSRKNPYTQKPLLACIGASSFDVSSHGAGLMDLNTFYDVELNANTNICTVDGSDYEITNRWDRYDVTPTPYALFNYNQRTVGCAYVKLQYAEVKNKGVFIPCIRNADGEVGVYNTITNNFLTNNGTGTFGYETLDGAYVAPIAS